MKNGKNIFISYKNSNPTQKKLVVQSLSAPENDFFGRVKCFSGKHPLC